MHSLTRGLADAGAPRIVLHPRDPAPSVALEAASLRPDLWAALSRAEIEALPLVLGRRRYALGDLFTVEGERADTVVIDGGVPSLAGLGSGMAGGTLLVRGNVGARAGAGMRGGQVLVEGDAGPCVGLGMRGGHLQVSGNAGPRAGGAWPGARGGMAGGRLVVGGNAGDCLGERMRRGVIVCRGSTGADAALGMRGGTILALGDLGPSFGAGMHRGTIVAVGAVPLWAAFRYDCLYDPVFVRLYLRALEVALPGPRGDSGHEGAFRRYHGDVNALGKGEVLIWQPAA